MAWKLHMQHVFLSIFIKIWILLYTVDDCAAQTCAYFFLLLHNGKMEWFIDIVLK
jgi:hypothetical protein